MISGSFGVSRSSRNAPPRSRWSLTFFEPKFIIPHDDWMGKSGQRYMLCPPDKKPNSYPSARKVTCGPPMRTGIPMVRTLSAMA